MGADLVIAVNLNGDIVGRHISSHHSNTVADNQEGIKDLEYSEKHDSTIAKWATKLKAMFNIRLDSFISSLQKNKKSNHGLFDVIAGSLDIMQDRITRSRMAGDPPDVHITPKLSHIGLMEFDRAEESIHEGRESTRRKKYELEMLKQQP